MSAVPITPLDAWIAERLGHPGESLTREMLRTAQLKLLNQTLDRARAGSPLQARRLAGAPAHLEWLERLEDLAGLPFSGPEDLQGEHLALLCVPQSRVERIVTLASSGTTGAAKRICCSAADLERTVDFFHHGMTTFTDPGDAVAVLMPGTTPGGIAALLGQGLERMGAVPVHLGIPASAGVALERLAQAHAHVMVGLPGHVLAMARHPRAELGSCLRAVLLSADYVSLQTTRVIEDAFGCPVYAHWGMTETGYGGAVECRARAGMHLRALDLLVEVVDARGNVLDDGESGELVLTTLSREAMPLIRYRTGDEGRLLPGVCPCSSVLPRLDRVGGRLGLGVELPGGLTLSMPALEDALVPLDWLAGFRAGLSEGDDGPVLDLDLLAYGQAGPELDPRLRGGLIAALEQGFGPGLALGRAALMDETTFFRSPPKRRLERPSDQEAA